MYDTMKSVAGSGAAYATESYRDPQAQRPTLGAVHDALDEAMQLTYRLEALADRMCGGQPPKPEGSGLLKGVPGCVFPALRDQADSVRQRMLVASEAISRIERELP